MVKYNVIVSVSVFVTAEDHRKAEEAAYKFVTTQGDVLPLTMADGAAITCLCVDPVMETVEDDD